MGDGGVKFTKDPTVDLNLVITAAEERPDQEKVTDVAVCLDKGRAVQYFQGDEMVITAGSTDEDDKRALEKGAERFYDSPKFKEHNVYYGEACEQGGFDVVGYLPDNVYYAYWSLHHYSTRSDPIVRLGEESVEALIDILHQSPRRVSGTFTSALAELVKYMRGANEIEEEPPKEEVNEKPDPKPKKDDKKKKVTENSDAKPVTGVAEGSLPAVEGDKAGFGGIVPDADNGNTIGVEKTADAVVEQIVSSIPEGTDNLDDPKEGAKALLDEMMSGAGDRTMKEVFEESEDIDAKRSIVEGIVSTVLGGTEKQALQSLKIMNGLPKDEQQDMITDILEDFQKIGSGKVKMAVIRQMARVLSLDHLVPLVDALLPEKNEDVLIYASHYISQFGYLKGGLTEAVSVGLQMRSRLSKIITKAEEFANSNKSELRVNGLKLLGAMKSLGYVDAAKADQYFESAKKSTDPDIRVAGNRFSKLEPGSIFSAKTYQNLDDADISDRNYQSFVGSYEHRKEGERAEPDIMSHIALNRTTDSLIKERQRWNDDLISLESTYGELSKEDKIKTLDRMKALNIYRSTFMEKIIKDLPQADDELKRYSLDLLFSLDVVRHDSTLVIKNRKIFEDIYNNSSDAGLKTAVGAIFFAVGWTPYAMDFVRYIGMTPPTRQQYEVGREIFNKVGGEAFSGMIGKKADILASRDIDTVFGLLYLSSWGLNLDFPIKAKSVIHMLQSDDMSIVKRTLVLMNWMGGFDDILREGGGEERLRELSRSPDNFIRLKSLDFLTFLGSKKNDEIDIIKRELTRKDITPEEFRRVVTTIDQLMQSDRTPESIALISKMIEVDQRFFDQTEDRPCIYQIQRILMAAYPDYFNAAHSLTYLRSSSVMTPNSYSKSYEQYMADILSKTHSPLVAKALKDYMKDANTRYLFVNIVEAFLALEENGFATKDEYEIIDKILDMNSERSDKGEYSSPIVYLIMNLKRIKNKDMRENLSEMILKDIEQLFFTKSGSEGGSLTLDRGALDKTLLFNSRASKLVGLAGQSGGELAQKMFDLIERLVRERGAEIDPEVLSQVKVLFEMKKMGYVITAGY